MNVPLLIRRCHPGGDLGSRVKAELVQDAADVAVDGPLGYEQARSDLPVGQTIGDQPRDVGFSLPEQPRAGIVRRRGGNMSGLTQREPQCRVPAEAFSGLDLGLEPRCPERRDCRPFGLG